VASGTSGNVSVTTAGGTVTKSGFTFVAAPTITSFSPASSVAGATITIIGTNFTGATAVSFGGTAAASYTVVSSTSITAVVGNGTSGSVAVTTAGGTATKTGFSFVSQTGFIYVHQKDINEESAVDFGFSLINSANAVTNTWNLNDQATADNVALSGNNLYIYDIGVGHGANGDGELWVIAGSSTTNVSNTGGISGTVYHRLQGASTWATLPTSITTATAIDGAYANQFVYALSGSSNVYFYNNGTVTTLPTVGGTVTDVTANGGRIAAIVGGTIYLYSLSYDASNAPGTGGTWTSLVATGNSSSRMDMNVGATLIAYTIPGSNTISTVSLTGTTASLGTAGDAASGATVDIAYDDNNNVYTTCHSNTNGGTDVVASYNGSTWTTEVSARKVMRLTGGAAKQVYGVENIGSSGFPQAIWFRAVDNTGTAYWIDDERIKSNSSLSGNGILIPVTAGTYTVQETLPNASWDLGRFNLYDPGNASTTNVSSNNASVTVTAGEVVYVEFVNELLNAKAIALTCSQQVLQSFDLNSFGGGTYGTPLQGTAYHDYPTGTPEDGYYILTKTTAANWYSNPGITDHTGNSGYFLLVNASYAKDEFYRQRVTNLVPGLSYVISFYASNVSSGSPVTPSISYGLQDLSGNIVNQAYSGNFPTDNSWHYYSFTFTATTSTADLFLRNQTIGGNGNDLGLDDISINPVITPLPTITVSPTIAPNVCIGTNYTFSNTQSGGVWTSSPSTVATINAKSGRARGLAAGTAVISYTYTNAIGCVSTTTSGIIVSAPPTVVASDLLSGTSCLNQTDSLYATPSGGSGTLSYAWVASPAGTDGLGTANIANTTASPTAAGSYTYVVTVTDAVGCTASGSVPLSVSSNTAPTVTASSTGPYCTNSSFTLSSSATGGSGTYTYAWTATPTGNGLGTTNTKNTTATPTAAGTYSYKIVVNDGFCNVPKFVSVTANTKPTVTVSGPGAGSLCSGGSVTLSSTVTGSSGALTYAWSGSRVSGLDVAGSPGLQSPTNAATLIAKPTVTVLATSLVPDVYNYVLTVSDGNSCSASGNTNVSVYFGSGNPATVSITSPTSAAAVCSGNTISLTATAAAGSGTSISSYAWSGPGSYSSSSVSPGTITPTATGTYTLTVTEANGCKTSATTPTITVNAVPTVAVSRFAATLCSNTVDTVYATAAGGTSPYTYLWTSNSSSGGFTIVSSTNDTTALTSGTNGTTYTLTMTVTDAKSCTVTGSTTVKKSSSSGPSSLTMSPSSTGTICINVAKTISGTVSGGSSPYAYAWSGSPTNNGIVQTNASSTTATPTAAGTYVYTLIVTDNNGCALEASTPTQTVNSALSVSAASSAPGFCGTSSSLTLVAVPSGGSGTYSNYAWATTVVTSPGTTTVSPSSSTTSGSTTATISGATVNTSTFKYTATVTDNAGCTGSGSTSIITVGSGFTSITKPTATITSACVGQTFTLSSTSFVGGSTPFNYTWTAPTGSTVSTSSGTITTSPVPSTTASATAAGNYTFGLLVVDANNCIDSASTSAVAITQVSPSISATCGNTSGVEWVNLYESTGASWAWTTTSGGRFFTDATLSPASDGTTSTLQAPYVTFLGTYSVSITDANGCTGSGSYTITSTTCAVTLAVSGLDFTAQKQGNEALLTWSTTSEVNNNRFDVERSSDGTNWQVIGTVKGKGNSSTLTKYSFTDALPVNGINYYRLKQVNNDGGQNHSPVRALQFNGIWLVKLYPNPAQSFVVLEFNNDRDEKAAIAIQNALGSTIFTTTQQLSKGLNRITLNQIQPLAQGTYIITLGTNENIFRSKFIKGGN